MTGDVNIEHRTLGANSFFFEHVLIVGFVDAAVGEDKVTLS
jgi:hypothetical protein